MGDEQFKAEIRRTVEVKVGTLRAEHAADDDQPAVVRCVVIGCTFERADSTVGGVWWQMGHNMFEALGLVQHMRDGMYEQSNELESEEGGD